MAARVCMHVRWRCLRFTSLPYVSPRPAHQQTPLAITRQCGEIVPLSTRQPTQPPSQQCYMTLISSITVMKLTSGKIISLSTLTLSAPRGQTYI